MNVAVRRPHAVGVIEHQERAYGLPGETFAHVAQRCSLGLGQTVTPAPVALCLIDLTLARLARDPKPLNSIVDIAGDAACLREVTREV